MRAAVAAALVEAVALVTSALGRFANAPSLGGAIDPAKAALSTTLAQIEGLVALAAPVVIGVFVGRSRARLGWGAALAAGALAFAIVGTLQVELLLTRGRLWAYLPPASSGDSFFPPDILLLTLGFVSLEALLAAWLVRRARHRAPVSRPDLPAIVLAMAATLGSILLGLAECAVASAGGLRRDAPAAFGIGDPLQAAPYSDISRINAWVLLAAALTYAAVGVLAGRAGRPPAWAAILAWAGISVSAVVAAVIEPVLFPNAYYYFLAPLGLVAWYALFLGVGIAATVAGGTAAALAAAGAWLAARRRRTAPVTR